MDIVKFFRKVFLLIVLVASILSISLSVNGQESSDKKQIHLNLNKSVVSHNEEFSLSVSLGNIDVAAYTIWLYYDSSLVECVSNAENMNITENRIIFTGFSETGRNKSVDDILEVDFRAKELGNCAFAVIGELYNEKGQKLDIDYGEAEIEIEEENKLTQKNEMIESAQDVVEAQKQEEISTDSSNVLLDSLHLDKEGINPNFQNDVTEYYLIVDEKTENLEIDAIPENKNASVKITGNTNLKVGENEVKIQVISEDRNSKKDYVIHVTKTNNAEDANANLETLAIENYNLLPEFQETQTQYNVTVSNITDKVNILAIPVNSKASVKISGNEDLKVGDNIIEIEVIAPNKSTNKKYIINIKKRTDEEEISYNEQIQNNAKDLQTIFSKISSQETVNPTKTIDEKIEEEEEQSELHARGR